MTSSVVLKPKDSIETINGQSEMPLNRKRPLHSCRRITKRRQTVIIETETPKHTQFYVPTDAVSRLQAEQTTRSEDRPKYRSSNCSATSKTQQSASEFTATTQRTASLKPPKTRISFESQPPDSWNHPLSENVPGLPSCSAQSFYSRTASVHRSVSNRWNRTASIAIFAILFMVTAINSLPQQQQQQHQNPAPFIGCTTCHERRQVEDQSLDFFKTHILKRLDMEKPPNITAVPLVADDVIKGFYKTHGYRYIRLSGNREAGGKSGSANSRSASVEPNYDGVDYDGMQADDPQYDSSSELNYFENYGGDRRFDDMEAEDDEDEEEQFFSTTDSIFAFPKRK